MRRYKNSCIAHYAPVFVPCIRTKILRQLNNLFRARPLDRQFTVNRLNDIFFWGGVVKTVVKGVF